MTEENNDLNTKDPTWIDRRVAITKSWIYKNIYFVLLVAILIGVSIGMVITVKYWVYDQQKAMDHSIMIGGMIYKEKPYRIMLTVPANPDPNTGTVAEKPSEPTPADIVDNGLKKLKK